MAKQSLLALMDPKNRNSAMAFNTPEPDWSEDQSAQYLMPDEVGTGEGLQPLAPQVPASMQGLQTAAGVPAAPATALPPGPLSLNASDPLGYVKAKSNQLAQAQETVNNHSLAADLFDPRTKQPLAVAGGNADQAQGVLDTEARAEAQDAGNFKHYQDLAGFLSPQETEKRNIEQANKESLASAPTVAAHKGDMEKQALVNKGLTDRAAIDAQGKVAVAGAKAGAGDAPNQLKVQARLAKTTGDALDAIFPQLEDPELAPYLGAIGGRMSQFINGKLGVGDLGITDPKIIEKLGYLQADLTHAVTSVARTYNQRGATKELIHEFEREINQARDPQLLHGALRSARDKMIHYAMLDQPHEGDTAPVDPLAKVLSPAKTVRYDFNGNPLP